MTAKSKNLDSMHRVEFGSSLCSLSLPLAVSAAWGPQFRETYMSGAGKLELVESWVARVSVVAVQLLPTGRQRAQLPPNGLWCIGHARCCLAFGQGGNVCAYNLETHSCPAGHLFSALLHRLQVVQAWDEQDEQDEALLTQLGAPVFRRTSNSAAECLGSGPNGKHGGGLQASILKILHYSCDGLPIQ